MATEPIGGPQAASEGPVGIFRSANGTQRKQVQEILVDTVPRRVKPTLVEPDKSQDSWTIKKGFIGLAKLAGRGFALVTTPVTVPILYLGLTGATVISKILGHKPDVSYREVGRASEKAKLHFYQATF